MPLPSFSGCLRIHLKLFEPELPVAPAVMVGDEIVVEGSDVSQDKVESVICRYCGISESEPEKKGILGRLFGK